MREREGCRSMVYVYGDGPKPAEIMLIGERPGKEESQRGRPFTGKSGLELNRYLLEGGIQRSDVYVTNLCKSYSPSNADPTPEEIAQDEHFLFDELREVKPKYIGLVGRYAARYFLWNDLEMEWAHGLPFYGRAHGLMLTSMMPLYHPAFGLHSPGMTPLVWSDFQAFSRMVKGERMSTSHLIDACPDTHYERLSGDLLLEPFIGSGPIYIDTEGTPDKPWGLSFTQKPGEGYVILASNKLSLHYFRVILQQWKLPVVLHNAFHDIAVLRAMGIDIEGMGLHFSDTMVKAYHLCLYPQGLKPLARRLCGMRMQSYEDVVGEAGKEKAIEWLVEAHRWSLRRYPEPSHMQTRPTLGRRKGTTTIRKLTIQSC
jgi:uracil-DNA glycosylase